MIAMAAGGCRAPDSAASLCQAELRSLVILAEVSGGRKPVKPAVEIRMAQETEIKLSIDDVKALLRRFKRLHIRPLHSGAARVHEMNVIFDTPQGGLAKHGQLLRIRTETPAPTARKTKASRPKKASTQRILLTFKQPAAAAAGDRSSLNSRRHKVREELELEVPDSATLTKIFEGLGMKGWFRYEKYRTTFQFSPSAAWAKGLLLELDETPIGTFLELEGPPDAIDRAAQELGYSSRDYILKNYLVLHAEACRRAGQEPRDMLFSPAK